MCSGKSTDVYHPTLPDLILAALIAVTEKDGKLQPMAFTEKALEVYLNARFELAPSPYLENTLKWLLREKTAQEIKRGDKFYFAMPNYSLDAFERMKGYRPEFVLIG